MIGSFVNAVTGQEIHTDGDTKKELCRRFRKVVEANGFRRTGWKLTQASLTGVPESEQVSG